MSFSNKKIQKKYKSFVELINDVENKGTFSKVFVGYDAKDILKKYSNKYIFITEPEEIEDNTDLLSSSGKISSKDLLWLFEGFASFKGLSMEKVTDVLYKKAKKKSLKALLFKIKQKVKEGNKVSSVLGSKDYIKYIPNYMLELIKIGEVSSKEDETYKILVEKLRMQQKIISKTRSALIYPTIIIVFVIALIVFLLIYLVPQFATIFHGKEHMLPALTKSVISTSNFLKEHVILFFGSIFLFIFILSFLIKNVYSIKKIWYMFLMKIPAIGWIIRMNTEILMLQLFYFGEFAIASGSGSFNYNKLTKMILDGIKNPLYKEQFAVVPQKIDQGNKIGETLEKYVPILSYDFISYIQFGEESNTLIEKVEYLYKKYTEDLLNFFEGISKIIEPILIIFLGGAVGYIIGGIFIGITQMANTIR